tara:strand:+ start:177 stop:338 length:162 start_codon:yes stop_codon:yes gene_type:complete
MQAKTKDTAEYMAIRYEVRAKNEQNLEKAEALTLKAMAWYEIAAGNMEALDNE